MPEATKTPTDAGDRLYDADRGDVVRVVLEALKDGFLEPKAASQSHMSDYGSSAGLVVDRLKTAGYLVAKTEEVKRLRTLLRDVVIAANRMRDGWAEGDDAVKKQLWVALHTAADDADDGANIYPL